MAQLLGPSSAKYVGQPNNKCSDNQGEKGVPADSDGKSQRFYTYPLQQLHQELFN